ncbi:MAG TPA: hypothetical protein VM029_07865 [Opitutaceae bacterium]|nr:hypothetical protein [Opitutaceae bacterium]
MKKTLPSLLAAAFAAAALAHVARLISFNVLTPAGVIGALLIAALLAFAFADYRKKRAYRVRRSPDAAARADDPRPDVAPPDWTYTTRDR